MNDTCSQCKFPFKESSIQYYKRIKNKGKKICKECLRIENAEKNFELRKIKKSIIKEKFEHIIELMNRVHLYESINKIKKESQEKRIKKAKEYCTSKNGKAAMRNGWANRRAKLKHATIDVYLLERLSKGEKISTHVLMRMFKLTFDAADKIMQEIR